MDSEKKVFFSNITRVNSELKNDLYELLDFTPANPIPLKVIKNETELFQPKCDKYYVQKKKSRMKVRTVKDIRNLFEKDNYQFIIEDMEKQQSLLLKKIRTGSATDESTKSMAKKLLMADHPISRTAWQMLNNINPDKNANPTQFILWNGKRIRVVGSRGGKQKFICNQDSSKKNVEKVKKMCNFEKHSKTNVGLLRNSLNIKFKPGPLRRKNNLDVSHQKYHMGPVELVKLPKPALEIHPTYGVVVEPVISNFLNKLREEDGSITEKWAEFAVSVLGTVQDNKIAQVDKESCVTFNLRYKCGQDRILMRRDIGKVNVNIENNIQTKHAFRRDSDDLLVIQETLDKMLDSVDISLKQDTMYSVDEELPQTKTDPLDSLQVDSNVKERNKKRYGELDRLAVTVIQLPGSPKQNIPKRCGKPYCNLGCLCDSLKCIYKFKQHCGFIDCMFGCKCEKSKYKDIELLENDSVELIPGIIKLDHEINANLAKEEQKFHQTVVVSGEKSILLKSKKRTSKSTMKYAEFYNSLRLRNYQGPKKILTIVSNKLNCSEIEPWCMVHNLYKCFCKGRFVETSTSDTYKTPTIKSTVENEIPIELSDTEMDLANNDIKDVPVIMQRTRRSRKSIENDKIMSLQKRDLCLIDNYSYKKCARTTGYISRKYDISYYKITNQKILEMEKNDNNLRNRMMMLIQNSLEPNTHLSMATPITLSDSSSAEDPESDSEKCNKSVSDNINLRLDNTTSSLIACEAESVSYQSEFLKLYLAENSESPIENTIEDSVGDSSEINIPYEISGDIYKPIERHLITQEFLTPWIAKSYKNYMEQVENGKSTLGRPRRGKIILHLWESLLTRYRNRKNFFVVSTREPYRIYIATDIRLPFFRNCVNIDAIRYAELQKYPNLVKKILTNASNKNYFCILGGWDDCWEIIGSVKKHGDDSTEEHTNDIDFANTESSSQDSEFAEENWKLKEDDIIDIPNPENLPKQEEEQIKFELNNKERSKWFLMKLENDFTEIYCHKKGFYVEREKILHAINLARMTHKTVVINKQTNAEISNIPFGIYALPDTTEYCAVVGPYELEESLGLEIVKASIFIKQKTTKGYWITTNKVDNIKVLDDPLSFLPSSNQRIVKDQNINNIKDDNKTNNDVSDVQPSTSSQKVNSLKKIHKQVILNKNTIEKKISKIVKPIKICRTNGFYHLNSKKNLVKKISPNTGTSLLKGKNLNIDDQDDFTINDPNYTLMDDSSKQHNTTTINDFTRTGAELIKITSVYSESDGSTGGVIKPGMFILKPEEINKKVINDNNQSQNQRQGNNNEGSIMDVDIDNFLTSNKYMDSHRNNGIQSLAPAESNDMQCSDVWIQCPAISNLGWIQGKKNKKNLLNLDFPGFKPNKFYTRKEAFNMINRVLSKHIRIPKNIKIEWKVLNEPQASTSNQGEILNVDNLKKKYELTEGGLVKLATPKTPYEPRLFEDCPSTSWSTDIMDGLEHTSRLLEDETVLLWNETEKRQTEIIRTFSVPDELKPEMTETLQGLMTMNDSVMND